MSRVLSQSRVFIAIVFFSCFAFDASRSAQAATTHTVELSEGESIQAAVSAAPAGTTFVLAAGTYRMQSVKPKADDVFEGQGNVILKGSQVLTFERESGTSSLWVAGATVGAPASGQCQAGYPLCGYDQDLFIDGSLQAPASSLEGLKAGSWYFNRSTGKVYIPGNPAGHVVELGMTQFAFCSNVPGVRVEYVTVEEYAAPAQTGAIGCYKEGTGWIVNHVEAKFNHGTGIALGPAGQILNSYIHNNGQLGVAVQGGTGSKIANNEISWNNYANYERNWEAGASKFWSTTNILVESNYVHDNNGNGLWTDCNNVGTVYQGNTVVNNLGIGILHEISYNAVISGNVVAGNHFDLNSPLSLWDSQIVLANSQNVQVYENTVEVPASAADGIGIVNELRATGILGVWAAANNSVHNNTVTYLGTGGSSGMINYPGGPPAPGNHFDYNKYVLPNAGSLHWTWNTSMKFAQLQSAGQELHGVAVK